MNISDFLTKPNITTLWDVISDEEIFKFLTKEVQSKVSQVFLNNIKGFFEIESTKTKSLIDINKKYIMLLLNHIRTNYPQQMPNKIKIFEEAPVKESITYEEIQNDRKSQFEKDFVKRQEEFTNSMSLDVPPVPEFSDKYNDTPIGEMDKIIKEMTAKRNYEVEEFNRNYQTDINQANNWLKTQETSVKSEKFIKPELPSPKKGVTWGENNEITDESDQNIFKKLKTKKETKEELNNITFSFHEEEETRLEEDKITRLEEEIKSLNTKMDLILSLLQNK